MVPHIVFVVVPLDTATEVTIGVLAVALLGALVLSLAIKRRERVHMPAPALPTRVLPQRIQRATSAELPDDLQARLRMLTAELDRSLAVAPSAADAGAQAAAAQAPARGRPASSLPDDTTRTFAGSSDAAAGEAGVAYRPDDSTSRFYGADPAPALGDATQRFAPEDDRLDPRDFFGDDLVSPEARLDAGDTTHFFGLQDGETAPDPDVEPARFFAPAEPAEDAVPVAPVPDGFTGLLQALPPGSPGEPPLDPASAPSAAYPPSAPGPADAADGLEDPDLLPGTGYLQALPMATTSTASMDAATLDRVRGCLALHNAPEVLAACVLDDSGRVLAGDIDDDVAAELQALLAETGLGRAADVEQPVRLGDGVTGALLLHPTGAGAVLGALVLESGDSEAVRDDLRVLARQIGDAMRHAS